MKYITLLFLILICYLYAVIYPVFFYIDMIILSEAYSGYDKIPLTPIFTISAPLAIMTIPAIIIIFKKILNAYKRASYLSAVMLTLLLIVPLVPLYIAAGMVILIMWG